MNSKISRHIFLFLFLTAVFCAMPKLSHAASLKFEPTTVSTNVGQSFEVTLSADLGNKESTGIDSIMSYDSNILDVISISDGTFLEVGQKDYSIPGKISVVSVVASPGTAVTGQGTLAKIMFQAKAPGTATIKFICLPDDTTESNILENQPEPPDIIDCAANGQTVVTVGGEAGSTAPTGTPRSLPATGVLDGLAIYGIIGGILLLAGWAAKSVLL